MSDALALTLARPNLPTLPKVSFGPFRLLEAVPWLMFATAMRIIVWKGGLPALPANVCSNLAIFFAFLLAARRMIEFADGATGLGKLDFRQQLKLARNVLLPVFAIVFAGAFTISALGFYLIQARTLWLGLPLSWQGMNMLMGFDGIAFDQWTRVGMVWSALLSAVTLLAVLQVERFGKTSVISPLKELWLRLWYLLPAIVLIAGADILISHAQGFARYGVYIYWNTSGAPDLIRRLTYFFFIFGFASLRLWCTLAILVLALRESYRRSASDAAAAVMAPG